ncbi:MAG: AAA family ATPase [Magnetococcales bacterium]|nr:AAA family ATPase [Magnetococcales bacterium]MBF0117114.1 AAA family ATPase [Magnetococcales bacterium]
MHQAELTSLAIENMKSFKERTEIPIRPLTIIIGRNNSGKSTLIQSLLLLKQTLQEPRKSIPLHLSGPLLQALNLRELTFGWPEAAASGEAVLGPSIELAWQCFVKVSDVLDSSRRKSLGQIAAIGRSPWLMRLQGEGAPDRFFVKGRLCIYTHEKEGVAHLRGLQIYMQVPEHSSERYKLEVINHENEKWRIFWQGVESRNITVELSTQSNKKGTFEYTDTHFDHFIPYLNIDRKRVRSNSIERVWHDLYLILFAQPLEDLKELVKNFSYLSAQRISPQFMFIPATTDQLDMGVSGEFAAQVLYRRQNDVVHFVPPESLMADVVSEAWQESSILALPLRDAVNQIMRSLAVEAPLRVRDHGVGFQLLFGNANLPHVGRGLNGLLPLVELGLLADPLRFSPTAESLTLEEYAEKCASCSHIFLEEPEAHIHPKAANRLAHYFVSLAMAQRRLMVETHSDHLVRGLRRMAAQAKPGSFLEKWLLDNVVIIHVSQDAQGCSQVETSQLTVEGDLQEKWPADFMDAATDEESEIYFAKLDKNDAADKHGSALIWEEGEEPESEVML